MRIFRARAGAGLCILASPGCSLGGGEKTPGALELLSTNVTPGQTLFINAPIEFHFSGPVDLSSANFSSVQIVPAPPAGIGAPSAGPAQGGFLLKPGSGDKTFVFQPLCPADSSFEDGGFVPGNAFGGVVYSVTAIGTDSAEGQVLEGQDGSQLAKSHSFSFQTPTGYPLLDPNPFGPPKVVGTAQLATLLGPNLFIHPNPPIELSLDQPVKAHSIDNDSIRLEFTHPTTGEAARIPCTVILAENCTASGESTLQVVPLGILPLGQTVRFLFSKDVEGFGEADLNQADAVFHSASVVGPSGSPQRDAFLEEFDSKAQMDPLAGSIFPPAEWGDGILQAPPIYPGNPSELEIEIGAGTSNGPNVIFATEGAVLKDKHGEAIQFPAGVIDVGSFTMKKPAQGATCTFQGTGSNPLVIRCSKSFTLEAGTLLSVDGQAAPPSNGQNVANIPAPPGEGRCGGGSGGAGSPSTTDSDEKGGDGNGPFDAPGQGGKGGNSGYGYPGTPNSNHYNNRPGGGGAGNWGFKELDANGDYVTVCYSKPDSEGKLCTLPGCPQPLSGCASGQDPGCQGLTSPPNTLGEDGTSGVATVKDAFTGIPPPKGGRAGDPTFTDGLDHNDFQGRKPLGSGILDGELEGILGGQGGGAGGDNVASTSFPSPNFLNTDRRGGAGGGGGRHGGPRIADLHSVRE